MSRIRPPAVAGMFYPGNPAVLQRTVDELLSAATPHAGAQPKALIVPHAGYIYSGSTAALAYAALAPWRDTIRRVVLLGPTHRVAVAGLALTEADALATPLGTVAVDAAAVAEIAGLPQVVASDRVHAQEHSLEVHLPFLQRALDDFRIVPLAVGHAAPEDVAEVLDRLWGGPETLILVSSDLSHYHRYDDAMRIDRATAGAILALDSALDHEQACGATPIAGLVTVARRRGLAANLLDLRNSGDTAGDRAQVVGYTSIAFCETEPLSHVRH